MRFTYFTAPITAALCLSVATITVSTSMSAQGQMSLATTAFSQDAPQAAASATKGSIVALDIDIVLDQVSPEEPGMSTGQHHEARIYYDRTEVDPSTQRVRVLHEQHTPMLIPKHLNPLQEPMSNAWLDMSGPVYRYHLAASPTGGGFPFPYTILFDENTMRMTIRKQSDGSVLLAGPYTVMKKPIAGPDIDAVVASSDPVKMPWEKDAPMGMPPGGRLPAGVHPGMTQLHAEAGPQPGAEGIPQMRQQHPRPGGMPPEPPAPSGPNIVTLAMDVTLDQVSEEDAKMYRVGGIDLDRIAYDKTKIDPITKKVPILYLAHYIGGHWGQTTPTEASSLDLNTYTLDFVAGVSHGNPIAVVFDSADSRMAILSRPDFRMLIAGKYTIAPTPLTAAQVASPPPNADSPDVMPMMSGMPPMGPPQ